MDIIEIINTVISENEINAKNKGLAIKLDNQLSEELKIIADPDKIKEIVQNLLSNAIKYSYEGEIIVIAELINNKFIQVSVKDNGVGISESDKQKLFKRFSRLDSTAGREKGTGLGLFITKELVNLQGGEITVESTVGKGSTFCFTLPFKPKK
jgi:signal transduction histidine kinase